ncbi:MAG: flagellar biosynthetic protein FliR [Nitrospira sp.]|nr:MAG: flagellar biosynthetic protein FliR [Nitrospira sp.]
MTNFVLYAIPQFQALLTILVRVSGILAAFPVLGSRVVPLQVKVGLVLTIGLVLMPIVKTPLMPEDPYLAGVGLASEFIIGMALGLAARILFTGIELAGEVMGQQMGLGVVQLFDPTAQAQVPLISHFQTLLASLVFLSINAHFMVVEAIAASFELVPPFAATLSASLAEDVLRYSQGMFVLALKLSAPVMATMLLINLLMAILGRTVSQLNVFVLSFPITIMVGFLIMGAAMPLTIGVYQEEFRNLGGVLGKIMELLGKG